MIIVPTKHRKYRSKNFGINLKLGKYKKKFIFKILISPQLTRNTKISVYIYKIKKILYQTNLSLDYLLLCINFKKHYENLMIICLNSIN